MLALQNISGTPPVVSADAFKIPPFKILPFWQRIHGANESTSFRVTATPSPIYFMRDNITDKGITIKWNRYKIYNRALRTK